MTLRLFKDVSSQIHKQLYNNILLLTNIYPPSEEFEAVFKSDMFMKANKAAFHQVVYYLLDILDHDAIKEKIPTWPVYEVKMESKFRSEVLNYINELNHIYPNANIPNLMASHILCPGGYKFIKCMLRLSILVLYEHLKMVQENQVNETLIQIVSPHKNRAISNIILTDVQTITRGIRIENQNRIQEQAAHLEKAKHEAAEILNQHNNLARILHELENDSIEAKIASSSTQSAHEKLTKLKSELTEMNEFSALAQKGNELVDYVTTVNGVIKYDKLKLSIPKYVEHLFTDDKLDLVRFFHASELIFKHLNIELPHFTKQQIESFMVQIPGLCRQYRRLNLMAARNGNRMKSIVKFTNNLSDFNL